MGWPPTAFQLTPMLPTPVTRCSHKTAGGQQVHSQSRRCPPWTRGARHCTTGAAALPADRRQTAAAALPATLSIQQPARHCHGKLAMPGLIAGVYELYAEGGRPDAVRLCLRRHSVLNATMPLCLRGTTPPTDDSAGRFHHATLPRLLQVVMRHARSRGSTSGTEKHAQTDATAELWGTGRQGWLHPRPSRLLQVAAQTCRW